MLKMLSQLFLNWCPNFCLVLTGLLGTQQDIVDSMNQAKTAKNRNENFLLSASITAILKVLAVKNSIMWFETNPKKVK